MTPDDAGRGGYGFDAKANLENTCRVRRKYPEIEVGDKSFWENKVGERESIGNYEDGYKFVERITKSLGRAYYTSSTRKIYSTPRLTYT